MLKLKSAVGSGRFQLTSDGLPAYRQNVPFAFGMQVDFAQLVKTYASTHTSQCQGSREPQKSATMT